MLYRPALHGNWNALSLARRSLKDKFPMLTVPVTAVLLFLCICNFLKFCNYSLCFLGKLFTSPN
jgi:hypothetical protein